jgi:hypothetical protein
MAMRLCYARCVNGEAVKILSTFDLYVIVKCSIPSLYKIGSTSCCPWQSNQGVGAAADAAQAAMQTPWTAEQLAAAPVAHAHHPTGPVVPATNPLADMQET